MIDQNGVPQPSLRLWQPVISFWTDENGVTRRERGIVTGILYNCPDFPGVPWSYQVTWYDLGDVDWLQMPHTDLIRGDDLEPDPSLPA